MAPTLRTGVGDAACCAPATSSVIIDFPDGEVREYAGEHYAFRFDIQRELVETVVAQRAVDWSNALFLSCRFRAWRAGAFNEYLYNFFKSLSPERMRRAEAEASSKLDPCAAISAGEEIRIGDYIVERLCPHRQADLSVFGEIDDGELVCTLHGWRFDLETGRCLTADDRKLRIRRRRLTKLTQVSPRVAADKASWERTRGRLVGHGTNWHTILDEWLSLIEIDAGKQLDLSIVDAAAEVVEPCTPRRRGLRGALRRLGNTLGDLGWPLEQLNAWLAALSTLTKRSHRAELRSFESLRRA